MFTTIIFQQVISKRSGRKNIKLNNAIQCNYGIEAYLHSIWFTDLLKYITFFYNYFFLVHSSHLLCKHTDHLEHLFTTILKSPPKQQNTSHSNQTWDTQHLNYSGITPCKRKAYKLLWCFFIIEMHQIICKTFQIYVLSFSEVLVSLWYSADRGCSTLALSKYSSKFH